MVDTNSEAAQQERKDLHDSQLQEQVKVNLKHNKEKALLDQEAEEEKQRTFLSLEEQSLQQIQQAIKKREMEFQKELAEKQSHISVDESDKLIAAHQKEMQALKENLEAEKQKQKQVFTMNIANTIILLYSGHICVLYEYFAGFFCQDNKSHTL